MKCINKQHTPKLCINFHFYWICKDEDRIRRDLRAKCGELILIHLINLYLNFYLPPEYKVECGRWRGKRLQCQSNLTAYRKRTELL